MADTDHDDKFPPDHWWGSWGGSAPVRPPRWWEFRRRRDAEQDRLDRLAVMYQGRSGA